MTRLSLWGERLNYHLPACLWGHPNPTGTMKYKAKDPWLIVSLCDFLWTAWSPFAIRDATEAPREASALSTAVRAVQRIFIFLQLSKLLLKKEKKRKDPQGRHSTPATSRTLAILSCGCDVCLRAVIQSSLCSKTLRTTNPSESYCRCSVFVPDSRLRIDCLVVSALIPDRHRALSPSVLKASRWC